MHCAGNTAETCGGSNRLSVYNFTAYVAPSAVQNIGTYALKGCYTDSTGARGLSAYSFTNGRGMTEELCVGTCAAKGFALAGVEYGEECYCGNVLASSSTVAPGGMADCEVMFCPGNGKQYCSAGNRLLVLFDGAIESLVRIFLCCVLLHSHY